MKVSKTSKKLSARYGAMSKIQQGKVISHAQFLSIFKLAKVEKKSLGAIRAYLLLPDGAVKQNLPLECEVLQASKKDTELYGLLNKLVRFTTDKDGNKRYNEFWTLQAVRSYLPELIKFTKGSQAERDSAVIDIDKILKAKEVAKAAKKAKLDALVEQANKVAKKAA